MREFIRFTKADRCFIVGRDIHLELAELRRLAWYLAATGSGVLTLGLAGGWWLSSRAIRPIESISAIAEKIATGDLSQRIDAGGFAEELRRLAGVLNSAFARLDAAFTQQARFTADAAHELRTPVSVMLMHTQNGLASEHLTGEQREAFEASQRAAQRMRRLIESLLELTRFDAGQETLKREGFASRMWRGIASRCSNLSRMNAASGSFARSPRRRASATRLEFRKSSRIFFRMPSNTIVSMAKSA